MRHDEDDEDRRRVARDGERVRVPLMMCDSTQRAIAGPKVARAEYIQRTVDSHKNPTRDFEPPAVATLAPDTPARQRWVRGLEDAYLNRPPAWPIGALLQALNPALASGRIREPDEPDPSEALDAAPRGRDGYIARLQTAHKGNAA